MTQIIRLFIRGARDLALHPWANLFTLMAVTMVTVLAGVFMLLLHNVNLELVRNQGQVEFQIFWKAETEIKEIQAQWKRIQNMPNLDTIQTYTPDQALDELAQSLSDDGDFTWLKGENPLPPSALVTFSLPPGDQSEVWAAGLLGELKALPYVDSVHFNPLQMDLAHSWLALSHTIIWPTIGFLGLVVALVVGNTIKLSLMTRADELEILYLVGAKTWYIRSPLLAAGALQGLMGAGVALGLLKFAQLYLEDILNFPPIFIKIQYLPMPQCLTLAAIVTFVSVISSWVAVRK